MDSERIPCGLATGILQFFLKSTSLWVSLEIIRSPTTVEFLEDKSIIYLLYKYAGESDL
jgi:hypothetical protein